MTAQTMTILDFLLARIAEDEAEARWVHEDGCDRHNPPGFPCDCDWGERRVLAECAAKRKIIRSHLYTEGGAHGCADPEDALGDELYVRRPCPTLAALASVYASHADFRPEWAA